MILPTSFSTALVLARAGVPERIGYRGDGRGALLTRAVRLAPAAGEHQVWKHLRLAAAAGAAPAAAPGRVLGRAGRRPGGRPDAASPRPASPARYVAAHVASFAHAAKRWDLARFAAVFDGLARRGLSVVLLGSAGEKPVNAEAASLAGKARVVDLSGRTTLPEALGVLASARLFVGNDSGLAHLASAAGTPGGRRLRTDGPRRDAAVGRAARGRQARPPRARAAADALRAVRVPDLPDRPRVHGGRDGGRRPRGGGVGSRLKRSAGSGAVLDAGTFLMPEPWV